MKNESNKITVKEVLNRSAIILSNMARIINAIAELVREISVAIPAKEGTWDE